MPNDAYYKSTEWKRLREAALRRDHFTCVVPGCSHVARAVDHIVARKDGGQDTLDNLRSLCRRHDNQIKENARGVRGNDGRLRAIGCDAQGVPLDPSHWWNE